MRMYSPLKISASVSISDSGVRVDRDENLSDSGKQLWALTQRRTAFLHSGQRWEIKHFSVAVWIKITDADTLSTSTSTLDYLYLLTRRYWAIITAVAISSSPSFSFSPSCCSSVSLVGSSSALTVTSNSGSMAAHSSEALITATAIKDKLQYLFFCYHCFRTGGRLKLMHPEKNKSLQVSPPAGLCLVYHVWGYYSSQV